MLGGKQAEEDDAAVLFNNSVHLSSLWVFGALFCDKTRKFLYIVAVGVPIITCSFKKCFLFSAVFGASFVS